MTGVLGRPRNLCTGLHRGKARGEDRPLQAKERGLGQILPCGSQKKPTPADILTTDVSPMECEKINICFFKAPNLWYFVMAALANSYNLKKICPCLSCIG